MLGEAIKGRRHDVLIATKAFFPMGPGPNQLGSSRHHLIEACHASLRRLSADDVDLYQIHAFDAFTPIEETLRALDDLVASGKIRYIGCSNFSGWHLMKSLSISERYGWNRYVAHQMYYSFVGRDYEWELMPLGATAICSSSACLLSRIYLNLFSSATIEITGPVSSWPPGLLV